MKAAVFVKNNEPLVIEQMRLDPPGPGQVHVKWHACGVCHSDVSIWNGWPAESRTRKPERRSTMFPSASRPNAPTRL